MQYRLHDELSWRSKNIDGKEFKKCGQSSQPCAVYLKKGSIAQ